jgi:hypothetical protein
MNPSVPRRTILRSVAVIAALASIAASPAPTAAPKPARPLESWTESQPKKAITRFIIGLKAGGASGSAAPDVRLAVFATEDVLWDRGVVSLETAWALDRLRSLAPTSPEWTSTAPFSTLFGSDAVADAVARLGQADLARLTAAAVAGLDPDEIRRDVLAWVRKGHDASRSSVAVARPAMRELLTFLESWGFRTYVVSDGPGEVTRALVEALYGLPPLRTIAPPPQFELKEQGGGFRLVLTGDPAPPATGPSRLRNAVQHLGMRPLIVAGDPEKDAELFHWAAGREGPFLALVFHEPGRPETPMRRPLRPDTLRGKATTVVPSRHWKAGTALPAPPPK